MLRVSERLHFEVIKRLMSPEKFRDFREPGPLLAQSRTALIRGFSQELCNKSARGAVRVI